MPRSNLVFKAETAASSFLLLSVTVREVGTVTLLPSLRARSRFLSGGGEAISPTEVETASSFLLAVTCSEDKTAAVVLRPPSQ